MTEAQQIQHLTAENARLGREIHKLHTEFEKCSKHTKALKAQIRELLNQKTAA